MTDRIERELELPASPDEVWQAVTDPAWLALWLADEVTLELAPGGEVRFRIGDQVRNGWVEETSPPDPAAAQGHQSGWLAFWWAHDEEPASRVELSLIPIKHDRTLLRVVETRPLAILDLVGIPLPGLGGATHGPGLVAA
jgi:uncharacterized protein YndB with AHSA1/START domain